MVVYKSILYPNYCVTECGKIFGIRGKELKHQTRVDRAGVIVSVNNSSKSLSIIIATQFVPNPNGFKKIYFKDGNHKNCAASNLCWVSGSIYFTALKLKHPHITVGIGGHKKYGCNVKNAATVECKYLKKFYETGYESYLQLCWQNIDSQIKKKYWDKVKGECYINFIDRAKRFLFNGNVINYVNVMARIKWFEINNIDYCKGVKIRYTNYFV
jgi:hypothetical protein